MQGQSEEISGLHSGVVLAQKGHCSESVSGQLNGMGSILGISDAYEEQESSHIVDHMKI